MVKSHFLSEIDYANRWALCSKCKWKVPIRINLAGQPVCDALTKRKPDPYAF